MTDAAAQVVESLMPCFKGSCLHEYESDCTKFMSHTITAAIAQAVREADKRAAKIVTDHDCTASGTHEYPDGGECFGEIAAAIRARGEQG